MFYLLAIALCLAVAFLVLGAASLVCIPAAKSLGRDRKPSRATANLLFTMRLLPLGLACLVSLGLALPAFVEFEPDASGEGISWRLIVLAASGAGVVLALALRASRILAITRRVQKEWIAHSRLLAVPGIEFPVHCVSGRPSLLAVTGMLRPHVFVAREIVESLSQDELAAALNHEVAHVASYDNLKQLLLRVTRLPRWFALLYTNDSAWTSASEVAADRSALESGTSVLDLSSALVKVGRLSQPVLNSAVAASHLLPPACATSLEARVLRLQEALESSQPVTSGSRNFTWRKRVVPAAAFAIVAYVFAAHAMLPAIHEVLESLVR